MGKGGGCVPSKKRTLGGGGGGAAESAPHDVPIVAEKEQQEVVMTEVAAQTAKLFIVYYSMYGHVESLAVAMKKGAEGVDGVEASLFQVPETLSDEVLQKMQAPEKNPSVPVISSAAELVNADAFLFGFPTRYGVMAAQMKAFFDSTGSLWQSQALAGKPAGLFFSTGTQGGGQETTAWTAITQLVHHGMLFVPIGYTFGSGMFTMDEVKGGSPYGAGVFAGDGTRRPSELELAAAEHQGKYMATILKRIKKHL